mmetsp:Transcript_25551/g.67887  ORF Transcript_25551/g.67887 Transcript_25551/m.67887 type:complete len:119 (+) Transcript_25551:2-358(+)
MASGDAAQLGSSVLPAAPSSVLNDSPTFTTTMNMVPRFVGRLMAKMRERCAYSWPPLVGMAEDVGCDQTLQLLDQELFPQICEMLGEVSEEQSSRLHSAIRDAGQASLDEWKRSTQMH